MNHPDPKELNAVITEANLRTAAGDRVCGLTYFEAGGVTGLVLSEQTINARVTGGDEYAVHLWNNDGELGHSCTCPVGDDGAAKK